jgi:hypothetical protein
MLAAKITAKGVVLFRLSGVDPATKATLCLNVITHFGEKISGAFTVVYKYFVKMHLS